jgi:hypothetical protein
MKKLIQNNPRGLTAAIAVLACCTGAANATVEENKGPNAIAFSEQRGDRSANLVLSTLDLAMMDPAERDNMLASLETQFGKPKVWVSRAARSTSKSVFAFARDGAKEKYGVRLRARELSPVFNSEVSTTLPADDARVSEQIASASLLGVSRSEVLTSVSSFLFQDSWTGNGTQFDDFKYVSEDHLWDQIFNHKLNFGTGRFSPTYYGFSVSAKVEAEWTARVSMKRYWYDVFKAGKKLGRTRDSQANVGLGMRPMITGTAKWGYDWSFGWFGHWGLGAEVAVSVFPWITAQWDLNSHNTSDVADYTNFDLKPSLSIKADGTVWLGREEHASRDNDTVDPDHSRNKESHKLIYGIKGGVQFNGDLSASASVYYSDYDWYNDKWSDKIYSGMSFGAASMSGILLAKEEIKTKFTTYGVGFKLWEGSLTSSSIHRREVHIESSNDKRYSGYKTWDRLL